jgi:hypothetical protein
MSTHRLLAKLPKERTCSYSMTGSLSTWPAFCMLICSSNRIWRPVHHLNLMSMCGRIWETNGAASYCPDYGYVGPRCSCFICVCGKRRWITKRQFGS